MNAYERGREMAEQMQAEWRARIEDDQEYHTRMAERAAHIRNYLDEFPVEASETHREMWRGYLSRFD